jgi:hypothetical protein
LVRAASRRDRLRGDMPPTPRSLARRRIGRALDSLRHFDITPIVLHCGTARSRSAAANSSGGYCRYLRRDGGSRVAAGAEYREGSVAKLHHRAQRIAADLRFCL